MNNFPNFTAQLLSKTNLRDAAEVLGITPRTLYNKLNGRTQFTWREICALRDTFFPDCTIDKIFDHWEE